MPRAVRPSLGDEGRARGVEGCRRGGRRVPVAVRVLAGELAAAGDRGRGAHDAARGVHRARGRRAAPPRACACACSATSIVSRRAAAAAVDRVMRKTARTGALVAQPLHLVRRARRDRARGARCWRARRRPARWIRRRSTRRRSRARLYTADCPDPDLLIRTSGEQRISNFLLWQLAYSELYITHRALARLHAPELFEAIARLPET